MTKPAISIIVPVYNVEAYLPACLESIRQQTFRDFELILVNDGSKDNSQVIIDSFVHKHADIAIKQIYHTESHGASAARNAGLSIAQGEYIYFIDSDDDIADNCLETLWETACKYDVDVVTAENLLIRPEGSKTVRLGIEGPVSGNDVIETYCRRLWYNVVWNKLYRRDMIERNHLRFIEGMPLEDELWSFEIACAARTIALLHKTTYNYYIRPKSVMSTLKSCTRRWQTFIDISEHINKVIQRHSLNDNPFVGLYVLENLLVISGNLSKNGSLTPDILDRIVQLNIMPLHHLWRRGLISSKQLIAYSYFYLRGRYSLYWYKILSRL